jgi:Zn-dependent peptidase ImmA (M78 family)
VKQEERARQAAESARFRLGAPPGHIDVFEAIKRLDVRLLRYPVPDNALEGAYLRSRGVAYVLVNTNVVPVRQRFTAAHELGHHFLHPDQDLEHYDADLHHPQDWLANRFAAHFLMDEATVRQAAAEETDPTSLTLRVRFEFDVSFDAARFHLCNLGLMSTDESNAVEAAREEAGSIPALARSVGMSVPREPRTSGETDPGTDYVAALHEVRDAGFLSDERLAEMLEPYQRRPAAASPAQ